MTRLNVGDILEGRYRIDQPIARGGMSTVYRCVDMRLGRAVAAKVMDERYHDDPVFVTRFKREARAMAQLSHPNLVAVHDFSADGLPIYLIMELITGGTLRELLAERGPMPPHAAAGVMHSVLAGLSEVHRAGLVHRDIKPDNVLITDNHRVKVGDFGLVRSAKAEHDSSGQIVGTVSYLSPEQVTGADITPASDVYSAGIVLFELLTGTVPFHGDTPLAHATARVHADVVAPSSRIEGVPMLFDALVATATARNPAERFADAGEFLDALDDVSRELQLPQFTVPVPRNSAAARTAAVPTDFSGTDNTRVFEATSAIPSPDSPTRETRAETREDAFPLPAAPVDTPAPSPAVPEPYAAGAEEEPEERPLSNRSTVGLIGFLVLVGLATLAVAVAAWWFGSGEYGTWPILWRPY
ncbi:protein kinase [Corynebacterium sp. HMSC072A04]|uniref:protein kinase domain-containing protein n=1 Tax=Corynebacterium sp. HMSC072A04 TaxID=1715045 RepID=UPI0008B53DCE|nr:protein kinase [Corynebacterium sp. HMSC072A04]OFN33171.1 serine/threonine protein kinase [Corynebacterium sp. HMSC072A04]